MTPRRISAEALDLLKRWEGCILHAYDDADPARPPRFIQPDDPVRGTLTIGYGHTRTVRPGQRITQAEAERLLLEDLAPVEAAVARIVTVPLTDGQYGALVSFAFNLGHSTTPGSPLTNIAATLNRGDYDGALRRMGLYVKQRRNGRLATVPGLVNRRAAEAGLWARGEFVASRHVAPAPPPSEGAEAAKLAGYAAAAATAAPALQALAGIPVWVGVALVIAVAVVAVAVLLRRERAA
ncbi:lysozyme [Roseomonas alkaliterrae]|uniref:Lysozyme n=1 Tax=Neoroseomonas alkaliterrae TaxID=1452450 RepID=A0A840XX44_9PROT|nr:lysozyme [Neoroseomonas alkaliterrae]MBB5691770.1 lysozyme [Neoroseomonas alkaliterrae]MBR0676096.1 lysozyme [Neoroseomonas alkaliterrae]